MLPNFWTQSLTFGFQIIILNLKFQKMKKILMGSAVLTALSLSIIAFQMSCSKTANAQTGGTTGLTQQNLLLYTLYDSSTNSNSIWTSNYDGSNQTQINIVLPSGIYFDQTPQVSLSPDGKKIFFIAGVKNYYNNELYTHSGNIYSCNLDGSNVTKVVDKGNPFTGKDITTLKTY